MEGFWLTCGYLMVLCDREGRIYDVWISFGSMHEVWAFRERKNRCVWFRELVEICVVYGDRGYRGCEGVIVCDSREMMAAIWMSVSLGFLPALAFGTLRNGKAFSRSLYG